MGCTRGARQLGETAEIITATGRGKLPMPCLAEPDRAQPRMLGGDNDREGFVANVSSQSIRRPQIVQL